MKRSYLRSPHETREAAPMSVGSGDLPYASLRTTMSTPRTSTRL